MFHHMFNQGMRISFLVDITNLYEELDWSIPFPTEKEKKIPTTFSPQTDISEFSKFFWIPHFPFLDNVKYWRTDWILQEYVLLVTYLE